MFLSRLYCRGFRPKAVETRESKFAEFDSREVFKYDSDVKWFPHHMARAKVAIPKKLPIVDLVVEVRDARIPLTSAQFELDELIRLRPGRHRIVVLNKADLVQRQRTKDAVSLLELQGTPVLTTSALRETNINEVMRFISENVEVRFKSLGITVMVAGLPNTGKSTLLNAMRSFVKNPSLDKAPAKISGIPGSTQQVGMIQISAHHPKIYVLDTPGVMITKSALSHEDNSGDDVMMKLAAVGCIPDTVAGISHVADYILFTLNIAREFKYVDVFNLSSPSNDISKVIGGVARHINQGSSRIDHHAGTLKFIHMFREGKLGKLVLDELPNPDSVLKALEKETKFQFQTEPPGPWGPEKYPIDNLVSRSIYKSRV
jgi:ribosome biogenesis GTPase A